MRRGETVGKDDGDSKSGGMSWGTLKHTKEAIGNQGTHQRTIVNSGKDIVSKAIIYFDTAPLVRPLDKIESFGSIPRFAPSGTNDSDSVQSPWDLEPVGCGDRAAAIYISTSVNYLQDTYPGAPRFIRFPTDQSEFMSAWESVRVVSFAHFLGIRALLDNIREIWAIFLRFPAFLAHFYILGHNSIG